MGKITFIDKVREFIGGLAFDIFLWASRMNKEGYLKQVEYERKKGEGVSSLE